MIAFLFWLFITLGTIAAVTGWLGVVASRTFEASKVALSEGLFGLLLIAAAFTLRYLYV